MAAWATCIPRGCGCRIPGQTHSAARLGCCAAKPPPLLTMALLPDLELPEFVLAFTFILSQLQADREWVVLKSCQPSNLFFFFAFSLFFFFFFPTGITIAPHSKGSESISCWHFSGSLPGLLHLHSRLKARVTGLQGVVTEAPGLADHPAMCAAPLISKPLEPCTEVHAAQQSVPLLARWSYYSNKLCNHPSVHLYMEWKIIFKRPSMLSSGCDITSFLPVPFHLQIWDPSSV